MLIFLKKTLLFLSILAISPCLSLAAQNGRITVNNAPSYEQPNTSSPILYRFSSGEEVKISSKEKHGWYRIALPTHVAGFKSAWIRATDVEPDTIFKELEAAGIDLSDTMGREEERKHIFIVGSYGWFSTKPNKFENFLGFHDVGVTFHTNYSFEGGYRISELWAISARYEPYEFASQGVVKDAIHKYSGSGTIVAVLVDYSHFNEPPFRVGASFGFGYSLNTSVQARAVGTIRLEETGDLVPAWMDYRTANYSIPAFFVRIPVRWYFWDYFATGFDFGYRYMNRKRVGITFDKGVDTDFSGIFVGFTLSLEL